MKSDHDKRDYSEREIKLNIKFPREPGGVERGASVHELSTLLMSMQMTYESACESFEIPPHFLEITSLRHPNMSVSLTGVGDAIHALRDLLSEVPDLVVSICKIPAKIREERAEIRLREEYADLIREALKGYAQIPEKDRPGYLRRVVQYKSDGRELNPPFKLEVARSTPPKKPAD